MDTLCLLTKCLCSQMVVPAGRQRALQIMVNITRWLRTIQMLELLPPPPPAALFVNFHRLSPYQGVWGHCC